MVDVFIALGSNLNHPVEQLKQALKALDELPTTKLIKVSSFYQSLPLGPQDQPLFVNAVAMIKTSLSPLVLLEHLQQIEKKQGRIKLRHWGERTIDLDILLYGSKIVESPRLSIPHKEMKNREFVLVPLFDLAPDLQLPTGESLKDLVVKILPHKMKRLSSSF